MASHVGQFIERAGEVSNGSRGHEPLASSHAENIEACSPFAGLHGRPASRWPSCPLFVRCGSPFALEIQGNSDRVGFKNSAKRPRGCLTVACGGQTRLTGPLTPSNAASATMGASRWRWWWCRSRQGEALCLLTPRIALSTHALQHRPHRPTAARSSRGHGLLSASEEPCGAFRFVVILGCSLCLAPAAIDADVEPATSTAARISVERSSMMVCLQTPN
jgi:hypothetical protein